MAMTYYRFARPLKVLCRVIGGKVTSGQAGGTGGPRSTTANDHLVPIAISSAIVLAAAPINASYTMRDAARFHLDFQWWEPITWQATSAIAMLPLILVVAAALRAWPLAAGRRISNLARHATLTVPFSLVHVAEMVELRRAVYALSGWPYSFASSHLESELAYEWRKDSVTYMVIAAIFTVWRKVRMPKTLAAEPAKIQIRDGKTSFTLDPRHILSVSAEGNYVRVRMDDGSHLIRGALIKWEKLTTPHGFRRVHRSALVNIQRVSVMRGVNAKDFELILDDGTLVRGSRRYKQTLDQHLKNLCDETAGCWDDRRQPTSVRIICKG